MKAAAHTVLIVVMAGLCPLGSAAQDSIQIRVAGSEVLVPVEIEGRSLNFLLDTGSTASAIDPTVAETLGLTPQGKEEVLKNFRSIQADTVEVASLNLGKSRFNRVKLAEINLAPISGAVGTAVDRVLGADILERFTFKIAYSRGLLQVGALDTLGPSGKDYSASPNQRAVFDQGNSDVSARRVRSGHRYQFDQRVMEDLGRPQPNLDAH